METLDFLQRILPQSGVYYVCMARPTHGGMAHKAFTDLPSMAAFIKKADHTGELALYHACASYKQDHLIENDKKVYRRPANRNLARSFWIDLDTGEGREFDENGKRKGYADKKSAWLDLRTFCTTVRLPQPLVVDSGNGLHGYWVMDVDMTPSQWLPVAEQLAACLAHCKVYVDTSVTRDFARVLRPVGTVNRKPNKVPREVVVKHDGKGCTFEYFKAALEDFIAEHDIVVESKKEWTGDLNSDLTAHLAPQVPTWAETAADHCAQLAQVRDTEGDVSYEHWRAALGVAKHCEDVEEVAIQWTAKRHINHAKTDTEFEMNSWDAGPATCAHFALHNPDGCEGCPHSGKVKSPITLGRRELVQEEMVEVVKKDDKLVHAVIPEFPKGFSYMNNLMCQSVENEDRIDIVPFCRTLFYPYRRVRQENNDSVITIRAHMPREGIKEFDVECSVVTKGIDLEKILGAQQIMTTHHSKASKSMQAYLKDWLENRKMTTDEFKTYPHFGWQEGDKEFLVGERLYCHDGQVREALLGSKPRTKASSFPKELGSLEAWSQAIERMYNKPGEEHRQYAIASSFGCALTPLSMEENYNGVLFAIVGGRTSKGKTTVARSALSVWGNPQKMFFGTEDGTTANAMYANLGTYQNLPMLFDEYTHIAADDFSKMCYTVSSGIEKSRLVAGRGSAGVGFAEVASWKLSPFITANKDLHALLSTRGGSSEAEAVRMIQISIDEHQMIDEDKLVWQELTQTVNANCGVAGDAFMRYVITHREEVNAIMDQWMRRLVQDVPELKYRFYRGHAQCSMAALEIAHNLGIVKFNVQRVYEYVVGLFIRLAKDVEEQNTSSVEDSISAMITALSPGIGVTGTYQDMRAGAMPEEVRIIGEWTGRLVIGAKDQNNKPDPLTGRLFLSVLAVRKWCAENRVGYNELLRECQALGLWVPMLNTKFVLGRGTSRPTGQMQCICLNNDQLQRLYGTEFMRVIQNKPNVSDEGSATNANQ
jgi:hypothetical protein